MKKLKNLISAALCLCTMCALALPASALSYDIAAPGDPEYGKPTSFEPVVTAEYSGTVSRIALNKVRYVAIFEGTPLVPVEPEPTPEPTQEPGQEPTAPIQFHWGYVLAPLGVITAIGGGIGAALYIKKRREDGYENEEDSQ